jgi:hypothetical protein
LARVVVGEMLTSDVLILVVLPVFFSLFHRHDIHKEEPGRGKNRENRENVGIEVN